MYIVKVNNLGFSTYLKSGETELSCGLTYDKNQAWRFDTRQGALKIAKNFHYGKVIKHD